MMCQGRDDGILGIGDLDDTMITEELLAEADSIDHLDFAITLPDVLDFAESTGQTEWVGGALEEASDRNSTVANSFIQSIGEAIAEHGALGLRTVEMAAGLKLAIDYYRTGGDTAVFEEVAMP